MRFFAGMHVPRCHVNTTLSNTIFSREYQLFACWLKMFFWIRVAKSMLSVHLVLEICGLKVVISFNFAPSAPHVKRRIKSCEPRAAAANLSMAAPKTLSALLKLPLVADEDNLILDVNPQFEALNAAMTEQMTKLGHQIAAIGRTQQQRSRPSYRRPQQQRNGTSPGKFFKPAKSPSRPPQQQQQQQQQRRSNSRSPSRNNCSKCGYDTCRLSK